LNAELGSYWPSLPNKSSVRVTAIVPDYRCGAVLELHQIPS